MSHEILSNTSDRVIGGFAPVSSRNASVRRQTTVVLHLFGSISTTMTTVMTLLLLTSLGVREVAVVGLHWWCGRRKQSKTSSFAGQGDFVWLDWYRVFHSKGLTLMWMMKIVERFLSRVTKQK